MYVLRDRTAWRQWDCVCSISRCCVPETREDERVDRAASPEGGQGQLAPSVPSRTEGSAGPSGVIEGRVVWLGLDGRRRASHAFVT